MDTANDRDQVQDKPAGRRRGCLGCLGRGALGLLTLLVLGMVAGAIYQAAASSADLRKYPPPGAIYPVGGDDMQDRKSTRLNSITCQSRMPSSA